MKRVALTVLIAVLFTLFPLRVVDARPDTGAAAFVTLDVCHASPSALNEGGLALFLCECTYSPVPVSLAEYTHDTFTAGKPFLVLSEKDRPPEY